MKTLQHLIFRLFLFLIYGCEQYLGYKYDVQVPDNSVTISGTVQNTFTDEKVDSALIQIGDQKTYSDPFGEFSIIHKIETDDERNKPVSIYVTAKDYLPYSNRFIVFHEDILHNVSLDYAAPLIENADISFGSGENPIIICTVLLRDYQGSHDIRMVTGSFFYEHKNAHVYKQLDISLTYHTYISFTSAEYTCVVPHTLSDGWVLISRGFFYYIYAVDYEGYSVRKRLK